MEQEHDGLLLAEVASSGSQAPFEELLRRHGQMVFNVCHRLLESEHEAEDAAQAVFLVLWKKAGSLRGQESVAGWLHCVAQNICRNAKRANATRTRRENEAMKIGAQETSKSDRWNEIKGVLDEELDRLPKKYKLPLILFHLEGRSLEEIATLLGTKSSTIGTRLWRAREILRSRFGRRGIVIGSTLMLVAALDAGASAIALPATFVSTTLPTALSFGVGTMTASGVMPTTGTALATEGLRMLTMAKLKVFAAVAAGILLFSGGSFALVQLVSGESEEQKADMELLQGTWTVVAMEERGQPQPESRYKEVNLRYLFEGNALRIRTTTPEGKDVGEDLTFTLDPSASPKRIDASQWGRTVHGIYDIDGDILKVCIDGNPRGRPQQFKTQNTTRERYYVLEREK